MSYKTFICHLIFGKNDTSHQKNYKLFKIFQYYFMSFNIEQHMDTCANLRCFMEQPRLHNAKYLHNFLEIRNFLCLIWKLSLFNLEMNGPDVVAEGCTHFPQLLVWGKKEKPGVGTLELKLEQDLKRIGKKYPSQSRLNPDK